MRRVRRPLQRLLWVGRWLLLAVALVWLGVRSWTLHLVRTAVPEFEAAHGSLDPEVLRRPAPIDARNGARYFEAAARLFDLSPDDGRAVSAQLEQGLLLDASASDPAPLRELRRSRRLPLELLSAGAAQAECVFAAVPRRLDAPEASPPFSEFLRLGNTRLALGLAKAEAGEVDDLRSAILEVLALSNCLQRERFVNGQFVGMLLESRALRLAEATGARGLLDPILEELLEQLPRDETLPSINETLRSEIALFGLSPSGRPSEDFGLATRWNPFVVRGLTRASRIRATGLLLSALSGKLPPPGSASTAECFWPTRLAQVAFEGSYPLHAQWVHLREVRSLERKVARAAVEIRQKQLVDQHGEVALRNSADGLEERVEIGQIEIQSLDDGAMLVSLRASARPIAPTEEIRRASRRDPLWTWHLPPVIR